MRFFSRKYDFNIPEGGICAIEKVHLGGIDQYVLIQGESPSNPVLLLLHGGPSMPIPGVSSKGRDYTIATNTKELVKHYTVVFWDQRGTGKSYHPSIPANTMTVPQFVSDTLEVTDYLRKKFSQNKIFLAGHSWGSILGLMAVSQQPHKYHSYIGLSQVINWTENDRLGLEWTKEEAKRRNNLKALRELNAVGEPPFVESVEQWGILRRWQRNFGTLIYTDEHIKHPGLFKITMDMLLSKVYSIKDMFNTFYKGFQLVYSLEFIQELPRIDFMRTAAQVSIPVTFIHGAKDVHVYGSLAEEFFNRLKADQGKRFIWLDKSGHAFHPDDTRMIEKHLIEELRHL